MLTRFPILLAGGFTGLFVAVVAAQDAPPADYVKAMQDIQAAMQTFNELGKTKDFKDAAQAGAAARTAFSYVEQFWAKRKDTEAAQLATNAGKAAGDAVAAAGLNSPEGIQYAAMQMGETCMTCHTAHRVRRDDGSFAIK